MPNVIPTFARREEVEGRADKRQHVIEGSGTRRSEKRFQFGEYLFDRIEVGTVGRQESDLGAHRLDGGADRGVFVDGQVVEHDHIATVERGHQHLLHVRLKAHRVDGPVEDGGCGDAIDTEGRDYRLRFPMAAGRVIVQPRATRAPTVAAQQIGRHATFVEKHVLPGIMQR